MSSSPPPRPARSLFAALTEQRRFVFLASGLLAAAGIWTALRLPSAIYPELTFSRITIVARGTALDAGQVLLGVTRPLEEAVSVVPGVTRVRSRSIRSGCEIDVTLAPRTDLLYTLQQVQARVNQVRPQLPPDVDIEVERLTPSLFPILSYNLEGGDPATLYDIGRYQLRPLISRVPGVGRVDVLGSDVREVEVVADPGRLAAQGMTFDDLAAAIRRAAALRAVGRMPDNYRQHLIVTGGQARTPGDVANIVVGHGLRVGDLATVAFGTEDRVQVIAGDGRPAVLINITRQIGGSTLAIADSVRRLAAALAGTLPPGVHLKPIYDQAALVRDAVKSVRDAMLVGAALAVLVLLAFLRHARVTAISASVIPLTLAITVFLMALAGQTLNLMTLGAMAIAIGLVIDDAVVVTENIVRHLRMAPERSQAVREAVRELIGPVTASTVTTVVVFLPLGLLQGVVGQFFHALSITLAIAVLVSLALALTLIPLLSQQYLVDPEPDVAGAATRLERVFEGLGERYQRALTAAVAHPRRVVAAALGLAAAGLVAYRFLDTGFLPEMDEGAFVLDYWSPGGTTLAETDREVRVVEHILASTPEIVGTSRRTGAELGLFATEQNRGDIVARLTPSRARRRSIFEVIEEVRKRVASATPRLHVEFVQILSDVINDLAGAVRPVEIKLFGTELDSLEAYARRLAPKLAEVPGLADLYDGVSEPNPELAMTINGPEANRAGLTAEQIATAVSSALLGASAGELRLEDRTVGIRVRAPDSVRFDPIRLGALPIVSPAAHGALPLGAFASFRATETRAQLIRENLQQMIAMTASVSRRSLGGVVRDVRRILAANPPPRGVRLELGGQYAGQQAAFRTLLLVLGLAAAGVLAVMLVQFRSFVEPVLVLLAAPLSFVGAAGSLWATGTALNVSSFMGLILLVGLIVKNGIILLEFTHRLMRESGLPLESAIRDAARVRLRPILMTTLCTLFGLLPLALGLGAGSELQRPLAVAVMGGLAVSTPITLFVVPSLLVAIRGRGYTVPTS